MKFGTWFYFGAASGAWLAAVDQAANGNPEWWANAAVAVVIGGFGLRRKVRR